MILKLIFVIDKMIQQERSHAMSKHTRMLQAMASLESSPPIWSLSFSRYIAVKNVDLCGDGDRLWWPWWWFVYFLRDLVLTPFLKTPIFQLTGTMYFSGVTGCQRRGRGGGAINGKRGTKVSQLDTPEDMSCPMTCDDMGNDREIHRKHFSDALFYTNRTPEELAHFSWKRPHQLVGKSHCHSYYRYRQYCQHQKIFCILWRPSYQ